MGRIHVERDIVASPERVFGWLLDPANLSVSPLFRNAGWINGAQGPSVGAVRQVNGIGFWAREQITACNAPTSCSYIVVGSFPPSQHDGGTLTCTSAGDGTHVD